MTQTLSAIQDFRDLAPRYDAVLSDVWGVLHNGLVASPRACAALARYREGGGRVVLITNAPRPAPSILRQLDRLAVPRRAYDSIVTSGDLTQKAILDRPGEALYHIGPERDLAIFEGLDLRKGTIETADYIVCSGLRDDRNEMVADYAEELSRLAERGLPMVCANPDLVVERGHELVPCAGALAMAYEELGGEVLYAGKPHRPVYEEALARVTRLAGREIPLDRILGIGDAIRTDIAGAADFGIDSLFLARGIHAQDLDLERRPYDAEAMKAWFAGQTVSPTYFSERLTWKAPAAETAGEPALA